MLAKYGVAVHVRIPIAKRAVADYAVGADWTPAAGDVKISKDGGAAANVTNLPTAIAMGNTAIWDFSLTATEMQAAEVVVTVADAATKAVEDQAIRIETYGNASAQHEFDLDTPTVVASSVSALAANVITAASINADAITAAKIADGAIDAATFAAGAINAAAIATDAIGASELAADAVTEIQAGLATAAAVAAVSAFVDTEITDIQSRLPAALVGGKIDASVGALGAGAITAASVATGAIDADALATDAVTEIVAAVWAFALTELGATPTAAPTVAAALEFLFMGLRNKVTTTATETKLHNDAGAVVATATVSDNGTQFERSEFA